MLLLNKMVKEDIKMALRYKMDIMAELKKNIYASNKREDTSVN